MSKKEHTKHRKLSHGERERQYVETLEGLLHEFMAECDDDECVWCLRAMNVLTDKPFKKEKS